MKKIGNKLKFYIKYEIDSFKVNLKYLKDRFKELWVGN